MITMFEYAILLYVLAYTKPPLWLYVILGIAWLGRLIKDIFD